MAGQSGIFFFSEGGGDLEARASQSFGDSHHIRLHIEVLGGEHFAGPSEAGLDFVEDQGDIVLFTELFQRFEVSFRRYNIASVPGNRFDDNGSDFTAAGVLNKIMNPFYTKHAARIRLLFVKAALTIRIRDLQSERKLRGKRLSAKRISG